MNKLASIIAKDVAKTCQGLDLSPFIGKTILITGASGLLGTHLLAAISKSHGKIIAISKDGLPDYTRESSQKNLKILVGDLTDLAFCKNLPKADFIIHAAGYAQPSRFLADPIKTLTVNTATTLILLEKLKPNGKFLFISSSEVYSGLPNPPYNETQIGTVNTNHPRACYIEGKRCGEAIVYASRLQGIDAKVVRLSLIYGPGTRPGDKRVMSNFIEKGLNGQIDLLDHGHAWRTFIYVPDAVKILLSILLFGKEPIYNVGGRSRVTIAQLAKKIGRYLKVPVNFPVIEKPLAGAPEDVILDIRKIKKEFGKINFIPFDKGLQTTIEWQRLLYKKV